jgi:5'-nucleotidase
LAQFNFTLLHNNDGESALLNAPGQANYGGVSRFKTKVDQLRAANPNSLLLSAGDMFLAGPQFDASLKLPAAQDYYDSVALRSIGYDAYTLGNHEFDFGPAVTRKFIDGINKNPGDAKFLSANLDYTNEPALAPIATGLNAKLAKSVIKVIDGEQIGVVGATTNLLRSISSPGGVTVNTNVLAAVQAEVDDLRFNKGVNKIILQSHLQGIGEELALIPQLKGVDIVIAGGGEELMANPGTALVPGDSRPANIAPGIANTYPLLRTDGDGKTVALVSSAGKYKYVGKLDVQFNAAGDIVTATGNALRIADVSVDATNGVSRDAGLMSTVDVPVASHIAVLDANKVAVVEHPLEGRRTGPNSTGIRRTETNLGNLMADSIIFAAQRDAALAGLGLSGPIVGLQNGGGIRNDSLIPASVNGVPSFSELNTFEVAAFNNRVAVAEDISAAKLKQILEHSVAAINGGQFGQWGGLKFTYIPTAAVGSRVVDVYVDMGGGLFDQIINNGNVVPGAPLIDIASIDFLFTNTGNGLGGDNYPLADLTITKFLTTYQEALLDYVQTPVIDGGLGGVISAAQYPLAKRDRIIAVPEPTSVAALALGGLVALRRRRA